MTPSAAAVRLIKQFEVDYSGQVALVAYDDGYGNQTIGWGRVQGVVAGMSISLAQAEAFLQEDMGIAARAVDAALKVPLAQHEYDALVVLSFNCRRAVRATSGLMQAVNAGRREAVPALWMAYQYARNLETQALTLSRGLVRRRRAELELWRGLDQPDLEPASVAPGSVSNERPGAVGEALARSWTIRGLALSFVSLVSNWFGTVTGFFADAAAQAASLQAAVDPMTRLLTMLKVTTPDLLVGMAVAGIGIAGWQRITAAREGRIG